MEPRRLLLMNVVILVIALGMAGVSYAEPMGTAFTYQGRLSDANSPADGEYDMEFKLYLGPAAPVLVGSTAVDSVEVIDGYFTVKLDFGDSVFTGYERWLEIGIRPGELEDPNTYSTLSPRQEVTPAPYAIFAADSAADSDWTISVNDMYSAVSGNVGIGQTSPAEKLDVNGNINIDSVYKIGGDTVLSNTGTENILVGKDAGVSIAAGSGNSAVGYEALYANTTGIYNSAMGRRALYSNTSGSGNSAMGNEALRSNTIGLSNSAMGYEALYANTEGFGNSAVGNFALRSNTTGGNNTAAGFQANYYNQEGSNNTIIGYQAGKGSSTHNKSGNVFLGHKAGYNETGSDKLYIANSEMNPPLIYGEFDTGNVGIGTTNTDAKLTVNGAILRDGSTMYGSNADTHINLGSSSTTGTDGENYSYATVGGGEHNTARGGYSAISGGYNNDANGLYATVGGGYDNKAGGWYATIGGGECNRASGYRSTVGGGGHYLLRNWASGDYATVGGGCGNIASADHATIAGGTNNKASGGGRSFVGGGSYNEAGGQHATVPGGSSNEAGGEYSFAAGRRAKVRSEDRGTFIWADSTNADFTSTAEDQFLIRAAGGVGIGRAPTANDLEVEGTASKTAAGDWAANSDARIKADIETVSDALETLDKVRLVSFRYTDDYQAKHPSIDERRYLNVIAQEFAEVFPDYVKSSKEKLPNGDEILQVDAYPLTVYSAAAVQELHAIVKAKDAEIAALNERLAKMEAAVSKLVSSEQGGQL